MKLKLLVPLILACAGSLHAESSQPDGSRPPLPPPEKPGEHRKGHFRDKMLEHLPPELRARCEAAREKAMQDPTIQELKKKAVSANEELKKAMREAILKADPELAELLKKHMGKKMGDDKPGMPPPFANLSEDERQKLMAAREKAKSDPDVTAAEELKKNAKTPEERRAAMEQFHKTMKAAILKADPSLAPVLEKMKPPQGPPPPAPGMPGEPMDNKTGE